MGVIPCGSGNNVIVPDKTNLMKAAGLNNTLLPPIDPLNDENKKTLIINLENTLVNYSLIMSDHRNSG